MLFARTGSPPATRASLGVALLAAVIGALAAAHGAHGWRIPGTAVLVAPPSAPSPESCFGPRTSDQELVDPVQQPDIVPCSEPHSAELISLGSIPGEAYPVTGSRPPSEQPALAGAVRTCHDDARRYLGEFDGAARWRVPPQLYIKLMVPTPLAWRFGQHWFGCQAVATRGPEAMSFMGTMKNAYSADKPPALLGTCGTSVGDERVSCTAAHQAEKLSASRAPSWLVALKGSSAESMPPCPEIAASLIRTADPSFGGRLVVSSRTEPLERSCWISTAGGTSLVGSMIGHGDGPLTPG